MQKCHLNSKSFWHTVAIQRLIDALALVTKHPNFYLSPDIYCHFPGGEFTWRALACCPIYSFTSRHIP